MSFQIRVEYGGLSHEFLLVLGLEGTTSLVEHKRLKTVVPCLIV